MSVATNTCVHDVNVTQSLGKRRVIDVTQSLGKTTVIDVTQSLGKRRVIDNCSISHDVYGNIVQNKRFNVGCN